MSRVAPLFLLIGVCSLSAQIVREVRFDPPDLGDRFRDRVTLVTGQPYDADAVRDSIARLYTTGRFAEIEVLSAPVPSGVAITFRTQPNFFIGGVTITGVKDYPTPVQAINATKLQLGDLYTEAKRDAALSDITNLLLANGFHRARVVANTTPHADTQQIDIQFQVTTGARARIGSLQWQGDPGFPARKLVSSSGLKVGHASTAHSLQLAVQRLRKFYFKQQLLSARVDLVSRSYEDNTNTEIIAFRAIQGPKIVIQAEGLKISDSKLRDILPFKEEGSVDSDLVREGARDLRDYLQARGYFESDVEGSFQEDLRHGVINIVYQVDRGPLHRLDRVEIHGCHFFSEETLLERMSITPQSLTGRGRFSRSLLDQDVAVIKGLYHSRGFRQSVVDVKVDDDYGGKPGLVHVRLDVTEGPQTRVGELIVSGNSQISTEELTRQVALQKGQPFSEETAAIDRDNLLAYYYDRGFPNARFQWRVDNMQANTVAVVYTMDEGPRETVDRVLVAGEKRTRLDLIEREITIRTKMPLSQTERLNTQRRLYDLGVFNRVDMAVQNPDGDETARTMLLQVEEAGRWSLATGVGLEIARLGGGAASLDAPEGTNTVAPRFSFDATRLNVLGTGQTLAFKSLFSTIEQRGSVVYTAPRILNHPSLTLYFNGLADRTSDIRTFTASRFETSASLAWKRNRYDTIITRMTYRRVSVDQSTLKIDPSLIPLGSKAVRVGGPSVTVIRDHRDNPADSHRGTYFSGDASVASGIFGSEANFTHLFLHQSSYHSFGKDLVLARNTLFGIQEPFGGLRSVVVTDANGNTVTDHTRAIPLAEGFFSGGASTDRAFSINQAGPRDLTTGFPVGGNGLLMNSVELRFPVSRPNLGGVLFYDAGNVYDKVGNISFRLHQSGITDFNYMVHAAGFGVRYKTPIGPVRLDFGYAFNPPHYFGLLGTEDQLLNGTAPRVLRQLPHFQFFFSIGQTY